MHQLKGKTLSEKNKKRKTWRRSRTTQVVNQPRRQTLPKGQSHAFLCRHLPTLLSSIGRLTKATYLRKFLVWVMIWINMEIFTFPNLILNYCLLELSEKQLIEVLSKMNVSSILGNQISNWWRHYSKNHYPEILGLIRNKPHFYLISSK